MQNICLFNFNYMQKLKYVSEYSLLVHTRQYGLIRIKCPFKVIVIKSKSELTYKKRYEVERVIQSSDYKILYQIQGNTYRYNTFKILISKRK